MCTSYFEEKQQVINYQKHRLIYSYVWGYTLGVGINNMSNQILIIIIIPDTKSILLTYMGYALGALAGVNANSIAGLPVAVYNLYRSGGRNSFANWDWHD